MSVVIKKAFSDVENEVVDSNVTTEFHWDLRSLHSLLQTSRYKLFSAGTRSIPSPRFAIEGAGKDGMRGACLWLEGSVEHRDKDYRITINTDVRVDCQVTLKCENTELKVMITLADGETMSTVCIIPAGSEMHEAILNSQRLSIIARLKPLPKMTMVSSLTSFNSGGAEPPTIAASFRESLYGHEMEHLKDVELVTRDGDVLRAHGQILAGRSPVFRATFYGGMAESKSKRTNLHASTAAASALLHFIYTDDVDGQTFSGFVDELLDLAVQYDLPRLVTCIEKYCCDTMSCENVAERLALSIRYSMSKLQGEALKVVKTNLKSVIETPGWSLISSNHEVMRMLLNSGKRAGDSDFSIPLRQPLASKRARRN